MSVAAVLANEQPWHVELADATAAAKRLPPNCLHTICTSPPYYGLRDYGVKGQIGLEDTPDEYAAKLVELFRPLRDALHPTGTLWLNLGDSFAAQGGHSPNPDSPVTVGHRSKSKATLDPSLKKQTAQKVPAGYKAKDLIGVPWLVAFALRADGWYLRQWMPWPKRNAMPESAADRPSTSCETVFLLSKEPDYFFDMEAVKRPSAEPDRVRNDRVGGNKINATKHSDGAQFNGSETRNFRSADLWFDALGMILAGELDGTDDNTILGFDVPLQSYRGAHFAVWPQKLVQPMITAGTSERGVCPHCFAPHTRIIKKERVATRPGDATKVTGDKLTDGNRDPERHVTRTETVGWQPSCSCGTDLQPDDLELIETPTGERVAPDPSLLTGRAGMNRPRGPAEGSRPITRYEQRKYAEQLRVSAHREQMKGEAGIEAFAHYVRTDRSGARPVPPTLLESWLARGWLTRVPPPAPEGVPDPIPALVYDPFAGSGTTGKVALDMGRRFLGSELNPDYHALILKRVRQAKPSLF